MTFMEDFDGDTENIDENNEMRDKMPLFEKFEHYHYDISNYASSDNYNSGNLGWNSDGNLVSFDPRMAKF